MLFACICNGAAAQCERTLTKVGRQVHSIPLPFGVVLQRDEHTSYEQRYPISLKFHTYVFDSYSDGGASGTNPCLNFFPGQSSPGGSQPVNPGRPPAATPAPQKPGNDNNKPPVNIPAGGKVPTPSKQISIKKYYIRYSGN